MIKNIIFDLGNVIINYNQKQIINSFTQKEDEIKSYLRFKKIDRNVKNALRSFFMGFLRFCLI